MGRISGRKPTREERKFIQKEGLDTYEWLIQKNTTTEMHLIHAKTKEKKIIKKYD